MTCSPRCTCARCEAEAARLERLSRAELLEELQRLTARQGMVAALLSGETWEKKSGGGQTGSSLSESGHNDNQADAPCTEFEPGSEAARQLRAALHRKPVRSPKPKRFGTSTSAATSTRQRNSQTR